MALALTEQQLAKVLKVTDLLFPMFERLSVVRRLRDRVDYQVAAN